MIWKPNWKYGTVLPPQCDRPNASNEPIEEQEKLQGILLFTITN